MNTRDVVAALARTQPGGHPIPDAAPVRPLHLMKMAHKITAAAYDMILYTQHPGQDSPQYRRASRIHYWRLEALRRLAEALARQPGGA